MSRQAENARAAAGAPPAGGRMAAEARREQIVRVAMQLFSERGFRGTTTKEIAQAAGVSEAIIFRHFATKDELYTAIIDHKSCAAFGPGAGDTFVETISGCVSEAMKRRDDAAVFRGIALTMMEHHERDPQFLRLLLYSALEGHQLAQMFWDRNVRVLYEYLGSYVAERQRDGALRGMDPAVVIRAFSGMLIHHSVTNTLWDTDPTRRIVNITNEEAARSFADILLRGIAADPSRKGTPRRAAAPAKGKKKN